MSQNETSSKKNPDISEETIFKSASENGKGGAVVEVSPSIDNESNTPTIDAKRSWKQYIWDTWDHPNPRHRIVIQKVDICLLAFATVSTFVKYIDKSNLTSAYVSGMKEDLGIKGNELNYANTGYNIASIIMGFPLSYFMVKFSSKWFIIFIEVIWIIITFSFSAIKTPLQMVVLRTLLGVFECGHYPALSFLLGTYYTKEELARRNVILQSSTALGSMFAGYIQSGAYTGLNGVMGKPGWKWTFIIDGIISIGVLIPQVFIFPDRLSNLKPGYIFKKEDIEYLRARKPEELESRYKFQLSDLKEVLFRWDAWAFWFFGASQDIVSLSNTSFIFWLKGWNKVKHGSYTIPQINNLNTAMYAVQYAVAIGTGWLSDTTLKGLRWPPIVLAGVIEFVVCIILAATPVYPKNRGFRFFLYLQTSWALGTAGLYWAYAQEYFKDNLKVKSIVTGGINTWGYTADCIVNPIWFKTSDQPNVQTGHYISAGFAILYGATAGLLGYNEYRLKKRKPQTISAI